MPFPLVAMFFLAAAVFLIYLYAAFRMVRALVDDIVRIKSAAAVGGEKEPLLGAP